MKHHYNDIRSRIAEPPTWWDEYGVPRYGPFAPTETANIYANQCALVEISCQSCGYIFPCCFSWAHGEAFITADDSEFTITTPLKERIDRLYYGDPPNIECCPAGPTMSSDTLRIIEFWELINWVWVRNASLEIKYLA